MRKRYAAFITAIFVLGCAQGTKDASSPQAGRDHALRLRRYQGASGTWIYASSKGAADWMDVYLGGQLKEIEGRCRVRLDPGVVIALGPGETLPMQRPTTQTTQPYFSKEPALELTDRVQALGLPPMTQQTYAWCCALPTDGHLRHAIDKYFKDFDRLHPDGYFLNDNPVTRLIYRGLMIPVYKLRYVQLCQDHRKYILAKTAVAGSVTNPEDRALALKTVESVYRAKYEQSKYAFEHMD